MPSAPHHASRDASSRPHRTPRALRLAVAFLACLGLASLSTAPAQATAPSGVSGILVVPAGDDPADYSVVALTLGCSPGADVIGLVGLGIPLGADGSFSLDVPATQCAVIVVKSSTTAAARPVLTTPDGVPSMYVSTRAGTSGLRLTVAPTTNLTVNLPADLAGGEIEAYLGTPPAEPDLPTIVAGTWVSDTQASITADGDGATATLPVARGGRYTLHVDGFGEYYGQYAGGFPSFPDPFDPDATFVAPRTPTGTITLDPYRAREVTVTLDPHAITDATAYTGAPTASALHVTVSGTPRLDAPLTGHVSVDSALSAKPGFQLREYWVTDDGRVAGTGGSVATPLVGGLRLVAVATSDVTPMVMASTTAVNTTTTRVTVGEAPRLLADGGIAGSPTAGQTLTLRPTRWTYDPDSVSVRWTRDGVTIPGATGSSYVATSADVGERLGVELTAHRLWHDDGTATITMPDVVHAAPVTPAPTTPATTRPSRLKTRIRAKVRHAKKLTPTKHAKVRVKIAAHGAKKARVTITGKVTVKVPHHKKRTVKVTRKKHGTITVRLPRLHHGTHKATVRFKPTKHAKKHLTPAKKKIRVTVHRAR